MNLTNSNLPPLFKFHWIKSISLKCILLFWLAVLVSSIESVYSQIRPIHNDQFWYTGSGAPIYSQGGGIFRFKDPENGKLKYYWYGVHYQQADRYLKDPSRTQRGSSFQSVTCYSSDNLVDWKFEGDVLTKQALSRERLTWVGRLGVAYIKELSKYAMFVQHGRYVLITVADQPNGPFKWYRQINMQPLIGTTNTGDQTVFTDDQTGKSYLIYSYGRGRNRIYVSEIGVKDGKIGLLDCTEVYHGAGREGNCMFKYKGKYYMCASNLYGWDGSYAYYLVADNIRGPYKPTNNMRIMSGAESDYAHVSQTGFFVTIYGSIQQTVVYCGDRWADFAGNGLGYNQWCPLSFYDDQPEFNSLNSWQLDAGTGLWKVAGDNNYIKNGSFEADRRKIPSPVKPVQQQLLGWSSKVIKGSPIKIGDKNSPELNHFNDSIERKTVIGEKSLNISDQVPFERKVSQVIKSTRDVPLKDGSYELSAKVKAGGAFRKLTMYVTVNGKTRAVSIYRPDSTWHTYHVPEIKVDSGQVEVGFYADGAANGWCLVDDVALVRTDK
ncbi:family 43 glycosylhydrolase [Arachidicoccus terrestris]|uniref:family 43 glycosylhydrolase n=1 Tax=Arachidicoccus terrestris TaxID=2875539 RepID=UPI001CC76136|nr:family 43 glycosylhydrolase [Arachidicoccus terrestris]UAY53800.1 family 43 glycosylhydrolase [Arachidicoccus terrestris]